MLQMTLRRKGGIRFCEIPFCVEEGLTGGSASVYAEPVGVMGAGVPGG